MEVVIKSITDEEIVLEGYGVMFDTVDLQGEKFVQDTQFFLENVKAIPVLWEHNMSSVTDILGWAQPIKTDEVGVFFQMNLKRSNAYVAAIQKFAEMGRLGLSTGALPQTVVRDEEAKTIKQWQICEISTTVSPAEFRTLGVKEAKVLEEIINQKWAEDSAESTKGEQPVPEELPVVEEIEVIEEVKAQTIEVLEDIMTEEIKGVDATPEAESFKSQMDKYTAQLDHIMSILEGTPAAKAGYVTMQGGKNDTNIKSFGDFLTAIKRGDEQRLTKIYGAVKDLGEGSGATGGFLVPEEYSTNLLQVAAMQNQIYSRVNHVPVQRESGSYPALDQYLTPTAGSGQTAFAAGVRGTFTAPGQTFTETEPSFTTLQWRLNKVGGITEVENELIEDSPFAIEALLRGLFAVAIAARNERNILRGSGVGEPLGILNAPAAVAVADVTSGSFEWGDVATMYSRFKGTGGQPVWIIHPSVWPKIMNMTLAGGQGPAWSNSLSGGQGNVLNGYPILVSEHMPQIGTTGAVLLADLSAYVMFEKPGLSIAYSDQVGFTRDVGVWRFKQRNDGRPWLLDAITLADPQGGYNVSPFLYISNS